MKPETIDTITRHLKGIVAALEKEREPQKRGLQITKVTISEGKPEPIYK